MIRGETKSLSNELRRADMDEPFVPGAAGSGFNLAFGFLEPRKNMAKYGKFTFKLVSKHGNRTDKNPPKEIPSEPCKDAKKKQTIEEQKSIDEMMGGHDELLNL